MQQEQNSAENAVTHLHNRIMIHFTRSVLNRPCFFAKFEQKKEARDGDRTRDLLLGKETLHH